MKQLKTIGIWLCSAIGCWLVALFMPALIVIYTLSTLLVGLPKTIIRKQNVKLFMADRIEDLRDMVGVMWYLLIFNIDEAFRIIER